MSTIPRAVPLIVIVLTACPLLEEAELPPGNPPPPPSPRELPDAVKAALPSNADGEAVMSRVEWGGMFVEIVYDPTLDDAIARWGECLARVTSCTKTNPTGPIAGCIVQIEQCAGPEGGD